MARSSRLESGFQDGLIQRLKNMFPATPRATTTLSSAKVNKISSMNASGYTTAEIAEALGVSASTVSKYLN